MFLQPLSGLHSVLQIDCLTIHTRSVTSSSSLPSCTFLPPARRSALIRSLTDHSLHQSLDHRPCLGQRRTICMGLRAHLRYAHRRSRGSCRMVVLLRVPLVPFKLFLESHDSDWEYRDVLAWDLGACPVLLLVSSLKWNKIKSEVLSDEAAKETISTMRVYKPQNAIVWSQ